MRENGIHDSPKSSELAMKNLIVLAILGVVLWRGKLVCSQRPPVRNNLIALYSLQRTRLWHQNHTQSQCATLMDKLIKLGKKYPPILCTLVRYGALIFSHVILCDRWPGYAKALSQLASMSYLDFNMLECM